MGGGDSRAKGKNCFSAHNISDTAYVGFSLPLSNSDTNYPEPVQTPQVKVSVPRDCLPHQMPVACNESPDYPHFCPIWLQIGASTTPSSGFIICYNGSQDSGKHLTYHYLFIIKDRNEQPDEEVHSARFRRVLVTRTSVSLEFGVHHSPGCIHHP